MDVSFEERVRQEAIKNSKIYKSNFLDYDYLICSAAFIQRDYYVISAQKNNYQHLTGVNSLVSSDDFFEKCYNGTLSIQDFNFRKKGQSEKIVKGSVRRKLKVLPFALNIFDNKQILVEESFSKNNVFCTFATSDNQCTLGFINNNYSVPKTLLKNNELNPSNTKNVDFIFRKTKNETNFSTLILGDVKYIYQYFDNIKQLLSSELVASLSQYNNQTK